MRNYPENLVNCNWALELVKQAKPTSLVRWPSQCEQIKQGLGKLSKPTTQEFLISLFYKMYLSFWIAVSTLIVLSVPFLEMKDHEPYC